MQERFKQLIEALGGDMPLIQKFRVLAGLTGKTTRSFQQKYYGNVEVREVDILAVERCAQVYEDNLVVLLARGLCRDARISFIEGWNYRKQNRIEIDEEEIQAYVDDHFGEYLVQAQEIVDRSVFRE